jgi:hypothetical protein
MSMFVYSPHHTRYGLHLRLNLAILLYWSCKSKRTLIKKKKHVNEEFCYIFMKQKELNDNFQFWRLLTNSMEQSPSWEANTS